MRRMYFRPHRCKRVPGKGDTPEKSNNTQRYIAGTLLIKPQTGGY